MKCEYGNEAGKFKISRLKIPIMNSIAALELLRVSFEKTGIVTQLLGESLAWMKANSGQKEELQTEGERSII